MDLSDKERTLENRIQACMMQRQNMEAIFNSVADGIVAVDLSLRISNLNLAAQEILGYVRQEVVGESCLEILGLAEEDELACILQERRQVDGESVRIRDGRGREHRLVISTRVLRDADGTEQGLVAILRDVTELEALRGRQERKGFGGMIGRNHLMQGIYQLIEDLSDSDATILILGESGTGKERVAEAIHHHSLRADGPFVKVNCSALSEGLLESELFGHVKGAFTGAIRDKVGRFEQAVGGTIFLDEIGDVSPSVQVKLLRVLQQREIERVGSGTTIAVDVRVIAATHRDLRAAMREGRFREDLFYRLNVMPVELPPLRRRREDIPLLVTHFVGCFNERTGRQISHVDDAALGRLMDHDWPGNVRELENAIEHAFIRCRGDVLLPGCLPALEAGMSELQAEERGSTAVDSTSAAPRFEEKAAGEREQVIQVLRECRWNRSRAAARLGMHRTTLWRKMREWGIQEGEIS